MLEGHQISYPKDITVTEAVYGTPIKLEFWLTSESETSFFENVCSAYFIFDRETALGKFIHLHPWFCKHVVFTWKESGQTRNIVITNFKGSFQMPHYIGITGVEVKPVGNLTACDIIEEARQTIEHYDGTGATDLMIKFAERAKSYFQE